MNMRAFIGVRSLFHTFTSCMYSVHGGFISGVPFGVSVLCIRLPITELDTTIYPQAPNYLLQYENRIRVGPKANQERWKPRECARVQLSPVRLSNCFPLIGV
jgi:hypothetical protein